MPDARTEFETFARSLRLKHFTTAELLHRVEGHHGAARNSLPPRPLWPGIVPTVLVLDALRSALGAPITITSCYRDPDYNAAVGGGTHSQHLAFRAVDFRCATGTPDEWAEVLRSWRGHPFVSPVPLHAMASGLAPFDTRGLRVRETTQGTAFLFTGGVGAYPRSHFVHVDCRGTNASWREHG